MVRSKNKKPSKAEFGCRSTEPDDNMDEDGDNQPQPKRSLRIKKRVTNRSPDVPKSKGRWTDDEKNKLLVGLRKYGYNLDMCKTISDEIKTRSPTEVLWFLKYWKRVACLENIKIARFRNLQAKIKLTKGNKIKADEKEVNEQLNNIEGWINYFSRSLPKVSSAKRETEGLYAMSNIFSVIAGLEAHPLPSEADGLDFREIYMWLHNLINGNPMKRLSKPNTEFIISTLDEVIEITKSVNMASQVTFASRLSKDIGVSEMKAYKVKTYKRAAKDDDDHDDASKKYRSAMEQLILLPNLNPFYLQVDDRLKKPVQIV